jgi:hypothetical protein
MWRICGRIRVERWQLKAVDREEWASVIKRSRLSEGCRDKEQVVMHLFFILANPML